MDYYVLESYKRVDFIFKLIEALDPNEIAAIDKNYFLVNRFAPCVLVPFMQDGELHFAWKYKYYRPLFMIEDTLLNAASADSTPIYEYYESLLRQYQHVRAKAYELFKYHCAFHSDSYEEIKEFLCEYYNMRTYHQSNPFWELMQDTAWKKMDGETQQQIKDRMRHFLTISKSLFWKSPNRDYTLPEENEHNRTD